MNGGTTLLYLARKHDCDGCKLRAQCCPKVPFRKIPRDQHEAARDIARSFVGTEAFEQSRRERKKIEMRDEGVTILLVDQMAASTLTVADRGYVLASGHIVRAGDASSLAGDSALEAAYLGHAQAAERTVS